MWIWLFIDKIKINKMTTRFTKGTMGEIFLGEVCLFV